MPPRRRDQDLLDRIGARLQRVRLARGLTQRALAEASGIEPESISRAETGAISLSLTNLARLAGVLGISIGELVDVERPLPEPAQPPDRGELLRLYEALDESGRRAVLGAARGISREWAARE
jgi:transcriptional regulator with XRE-family HTH domain